MNLTPEEFNTEILKLGLEIEEDKDLDLIFKTFNATFNSGCFEYVNDIIKNLDIPAFSTKTLIGYLTASSWASDKLPEWSKFFEKAKIEILARVGEARTMRLLDGLE